VVGHSALQVHLSDVDEVMPTNQLLERLWDLVGVGGKNLFVVELELHGFIHKHLPKLISLVQVNQAESPFAQFYLYSVHLNLLFYLSNNFVERVFSWRHGYLVLFVVIKVRDVNYFDFDRFLLAYFRSFIGYA
jgi:hypothetical protein